MNPNDTHREQLSALLDGALDPDQTRFLLRRLQHDDDLAGSLSRWQIAGDALRGQAQAPAPAGFAEAIAARIAHEPLPVIEGERIGASASATLATPDASAQAALRPHAAGGGRWRWFGGGAMAASLAIVSVLALRPDAALVTPTQFAASEAPSIPAAATPVTADAASITIAASNAPVSADAIQASTSETQPDAAASTAANANKPARAVTRLARAAPARQRQAPPDASRATLPEASEALARNTDHAPAGDPFRAPVAKPWPRAVITGAGNGTFSASLDSGSYYPFAPRGLEPASDD